MILLILWYTEKRNMFIDSTECDRFLPLDYKTNYKIAGGRECRFGLEI